ncbi:hypothetical protein FHW36_102394 [Chitinophaga polysaccharea]|uniref:Uncharacterized protein n=1 Tax=Chitinophaga polysaccharea TaxID=1293035 RepID=A0A561PWZ0_9BACT|nr:hypothetical protein [Chitinophaga polysaccharea]TWF42633.1 hypothetical protein FHW36_102394 [Chitinophaga polysaccharea]
MDYKWISDLLDKYWEGETTLEEEATLRDFFSVPHADLPEALQEAAPLFQYFKVEAAKEWEVPPVTLPVTTPVVKLSPLRHWMKYAAVALVAVGIGYALKQQQVRKQDAAIALRQQEMNDPQKALDETKKALQLLARNLNKGTAKMQKLAYFNEATSLVEGKND